MVASFSGQSPHQIDPANLFGTGRIEGDDADEFWQAFSDKFNVELSALRPYLHYNANEPPGWRMAWGTSPDGRRLPDVPIGLSDLLAATACGKWVMAYPDHRLKERHPILSHPGLLILVLLTIAALFLLRQSLT